MTVATIVTLKNGMHKRKVTIDLEKTTAFLFQAYLATVGVLGKFDPEVKKLLKGTIVLKDFPEFVDDELYLYRYGSVPRPVRPVPTNVRKFVRNETTWGVLPYPWLTGSIQNLRYDWPGAIQA